MILKRAFDIIGSIVGIILLSPLFLLVYLLLKMEYRKAPAIYVSKRVGQYYRTFDLYKFRSMVPDAEARIHQVKHLNVYKLDGSEHREVIKRYGDGTDDAQTTQLFDDKDIYEEAEYLRKKMIEEGAAFQKFASDPRITKLGLFFRKTSIDELPQLFNILKGDMSFVGNRPLPPHEAEKLTTDKLAKRFLPSAGLTGLWQVTKRGRPEMDYEERLELDLEYADKESFWFDFKLLLRTVRAVFQVADY